MFQGACQLSFPGLRGETISKAYRISLRRMKIVAAT